MILMKLASKKEIKHIGKLRGSDAMIHLTNVAVQKHNDHYDEKRGGKWDLSDAKNSFEP